MGPTGLTWRLSCQKIITALIYFKKLKKERSIFTWVKLSKQSIHRFFDSLWWKLLIEYYLVAIDVICQEKKQYSLLPFLLTSFYFSVIIFWLCLLIIFFNPLTRKKEKSTEIVSFSVLQLIYLMKIIIFNLCKAPRLSAVLWWCRGIRWFDGYFFPWVI